MVVKHCAHGLCKSDSRYLKNPSIFFLRFPNPKNEPDRCKMWVAACRREKLTIKKVTKFSFICSLHFIGENGPTELNPDPVSATFSKMSVARSLNASEANQPTLRSDLEMDIDKSLEHDNIEGSTQCHDEIPHVQTTPSEEGYETTAITTDNHVSLSPSLKRNTSSQSSILRQKKLQSLLRNHRISKKRLLRKLVTLKKKINSQSFNIDNIKHSPKRFKFYTGLNVDQFNALWRFLGEEALNLNHWRSECKKRNVNQPKDRSVLTPQNQLFLTLCRLRVGLLIEDLAYRFLVSTSYVSRTINTWIMFMYVKFKALDIFPPRETDKSKIPKIFRKFKNLRVIIDGFEVRTQKAEDYREQGNTYSAYKGTATFKFLCGINSSGGVSFLSDAYEGAISDRDIFISCGITSHLRKGDLIVADRGFNVADVCNSFSCELLTPPFLSGRDKLTREEVRITKDVASARVHVERLIGRLKEYRILQRVLPKTLVPLVSQMTFVVAMLVNFQEPIIKI